MKVEEVMTRGVEVIPSDAGIQEAAQKMHSYDVGVLPVFHENKAIGLITDRDIVVRGVAAGIDPEKTTVSDLMTEELAVISKDADLSEAADTMKEKQVRRLLVTDGEERLLGVVSLGDIAVHSDQTGVAAQILQSVSEPAEPAR